MEIWRSIISIGEQPEDTHYSNIELEYYSTGRYVDNWMYYYDYHNSLEKLEGKSRGRAGDDCAAAICI